MVSRYGLTELYSPPQATEINAQYVSQRSLFFFRSLPAGKAYSSIIFVHGLFGHPKKTWSSKKARPSSSNVSQGLNERLKDTEQLDNTNLTGSTFWPQHLLPSVIPDIKIFTWGYDANVDGFLSSASQNTIHQHAQNLLSDLADLSNTAVEVSSAPYRASRAWSA